MGLIAGSDRYLPFLRVRMAICHVRHHASDLRTQHSANKAPRGSRRQRNSFFPSEGVKKIKIKYKKNQKDLTIQHPQARLSSAEAETIPACRYSFLQEPSKLN